jgi:hypothetical protein
MKTNHPIYLFLSAGAGTGPVAQGAELTCEKSPNYQTNPISVLNRGSHHPTRETENSGGFGIWNLVFPNRGRPLTCSI